MSEVINNEIHINDKQISIFRYFFNKFCKIDGNPKLCKTQNKMYNFLFIILNHCSALSSNEITNYYLISCSKMKLIRETINVNET